jgi:hypothetical protein
LEFKNYQNELIQQIAEDLESSLGFYCSDIYLTALGLYPGFKSLKKAVIMVSDNLDGEVDDYGKLYFGFRETTLTTRIKSRFNERFKLNQYQSPGTDMALLPFVFAHELGHIIQLDSKFRKYFGRMNHQVLETDPDYANYVGSDLETNADYLAAVIVGNSVYGSELGFTPPTEDSRHWRDWASQHPVVTTIDQY